MKKIILILTAAIFIVSAINAQTLDGTTWSYTERVYGDEDISEATSYFAFTSPTEVIWYFGTPDNFVFPVGFGSYDAKKGAITFSHTNPLHKEIWLYDRNNTIVFDFRIANDQATMRMSMSWKNNEVTRFLNGEQPFKLSKEKYSLKPNPKLVGTSWRYYTHRDNEKGTIYFKSVNEVLIDGEMHPYVYVGNSVSIKSGDSPENENLIGIYHDEEFELCRNGLKGKINGSCANVKKIQ
jgi:hypothetical protein